ncbi:zinc-ribbon domain-containing protein [Roseovarius sp. LXJ103]|uniref:zinc-ribbon domain-containing protein n=1 Tax=Roseovarius carneus TaxID=2853164 RepID=UPI000D605B67|nr:zinc-ribbon domain-containing protein [Roseovarius carneus]MBZ8118290.1 zinc-ribbon domain-containing protein [Roseovarius carneus]PWE35988.1 hypothetical protein DD563_08485 [Pelagicola sp. LXJ1103]
MRLTCPNCGAQYEVPDDVIPETGRDVQCSNCGDTWFQHHADHVPEKDPAEAQPWEDVPTDAAHEEAEPQDSSQGTSDGSTSERAQTEPPKGGPSPVDAPQRRKMDPEVTNVLREEAEREARARAAETNGIETQPDLGLDEGEEDRRAREARARMARLRGGEGDDEVGDIDPTSRRSLFPDIEEINSSLEPGVDPQADLDLDDPYPEASVRASGGFRRGFSTVLLIATIGLLLYVFAPAISRMVPAVAGVLTDYASWVDGLRLWLDGQIGAVMAMLDGMTSEATPDAPADATPDATPDAVQTGEASGTAADG